MSEPQNQELEPKYKYTPSEIDYPKVKQGVVKVLSDHSRLTNNSLNNKHIETAVFDLVRESNIYNSNTPLNNLVVGTDSLNITNSLDKKDIRDSYYYSQDFLENIQETDTVLQQYLKTSEFAKLPAGDRAKIQDYIDYRKLLEADYLKEFQTIRNGFQNTKWDDEYKELASKVREVEIKENEFKEQNPAIEDSANSILTSIGEKPLSNTYSIEQVKKLLEAGKLEDSYKEYSNLVKQNKENSEKLQKIINSPQFKNYSEETQNQLRELVRFKAEQNNKNQDVLNQVNNKLRDLDSQIENSTLDIDPYANLNGKKGAIRQSDSGVLYDKDNKIIKTEDWGVRFTTCSSQDTFLFELLPAINSVLPIQGSRDVPNAMAGLSFSIKPNIAKFKIAGFQPVFQHLGIDTVIVTIVGAFTGNEGFNIAPVNTEEALKKTLLKDSVSNLGKYVNAFSLNDSNKNTVTSERLGLEQALKQYSRQDDSFKQFNRFYMLAIRRGEEVEVEINTAKYDTFDIPRDAYLGVDRKTDIDKETPISFRNKRTGNPKFKGLIKNFEAAYVRNNRTYYVAQIEVTDFGYVNTKPPKLEYIPEVSETFNPGTQEESCKTPDECIKLGENEFIIGDPIEVKLNGEEYYKYKICKVSNFGQFQNDQFFVVSKDRRKVNIAPEALVGGGLVGTVIGNTNNVPLIGKYVGEKIGQEIGNRIAQYQSTALGETCRNEYIKKGSSGYQKIEKEEYFKSINPEASKELRVLQDYKPPNGFLLVKGSYEEKATRSGKTVASVRVCSNSDFAQIGLNTISNIFNNTNTEQENVLKQEGVLSGYCDPLSTPILESQNIFEGGRAYFYVENGKYKNISKGEYNKIVKEATDENKRTD